jgi:hypothetical protein
MMNQRTHRFEKRLPSGAPRGVVWRAGRALCGASVSLALLAGCGGPPQVRSSNLRLIEGLQTAVSAEQPQWVEQAAAQIEARHASGELADDAHAALTAIVAKARAGDWSEARTDVVALGKAQKPTAEDIERIKK